MTFTISADNPRSIRALEIAAEADQWLTYRDSEGQVAYGVPSQADPGRYYLVTPWSCDCADFHQNGMPDGLEPGAEPRACKHMLAVRLYRELVRAQERQPASKSRGRERGHLRVVPKTEERGA